MKAIPLNSWNELTQRKGHNQMYIDETAQADPEVMENNRELEEKAGFWAVIIIIFFWL